MSGDASENSRAEGVMPDAPPGCVPARPARDQRDQRETSAWRDELTRDQREEAGPFPEYVDLYINGELVSEPADGKPVRSEAPWIAWKDGWWYCIPCSRFAECKHQTGKEHLRKVGNWLLDHGYKEEQKEAVIQSIYLESEYSNRCPGASSRDSSAAEEATPGSGNHLKKRRCNLTPRVRDRWESWASASPGTTWPTNEETQALAHLGVAQSVRFTKAMKQEFDAVKGELKGVKEELRQLKESQKEENRQMKESLKECLKESLKEAATEAMTNHTDFLLGRPEGDQK